jgi:molybdate transport system substrate-binding protein
MKICSAVCVALCLASLATTPTPAAELKIFGSRVTKVVIEDIGPQFTKATGNTLVVVTDVTANMKRRIEAGEAFDLAVLVNFQTDEMIKAGKLVADTRADLMKAGIGIAAKRGAPLPDIATVEAFKRTLLAAKSIAYLKEGGSTRHVNLVLAQLGLTDALAAKTVKPDTEKVSELVASGEVELGIVLIPNILSVPDAQLVGPIPDDIQGYTVFTAAVSAASPNQQAARDLIAFLKSPVGVESIKAKGMTGG